MTRYSKLLCFWLVNKLSFILMVFLSFAFIELILLDSDSNKVWAYFLLILGFVASFMIAFIVAKISSIGLVVIGSAVGFFACVFLNYLIIWRIDSTPTNVI